TPETPLDLSALRDLQASGRLRVGTLQVAQLKLTQLRADLQAGNGQLTLNPLALNLYQGSASGSLQLAAAAVPRVALKQTLSGVAVGPLLQDLMGKAQLEGRGNVQLDVSTQGSTVTAMKKALAGSARAELQDGMVKGFNIAQTLRNAKARLAGGGTHAGTASAAESTDFSALSASLRIAGGVARNEDLQLISPLLRVGGGGDIDIGNEQLDYLVKATIVATLQGQGGPELQALRGQTVPVRLQGPFNAIGYSVDFAGMARELAKDKLDGKAEAAKTKAKEKLGEKLKGLFGK
ncbi:MAG: AsmA family protein, partial [Rubrivivax sp.]